MLHREKIIKEKINALKCFMYRRPILCTLYGAVDCLKFLKIAVVGGGRGGGGGVLLVHSAYIMSL
jgi:hypothetical protein